METIKQYIKDGGTVYYGSLLYKIVIDFDGDLIVKCTTGSGQELLPANFDASQVIYK